MPNLNEIVYTPEALDALIQKLNDEKPEQGYKITEVIIVLTPEMNAKISAFAKILSDNKHIWRFFLLPFNEDCRLSRESELALYAALAQNQSIEYLRLDFYFDYDVAQTLKPEEDLAIPTLGNALAVNTTLRRFEFGRRPPEDVEEITPCEAQALDFYRSQFNSTLVELNSLTCDSPSPGIIATNQRNQSLLVLEESATAHVRILNLTKFLPNALIEVVDSYLEETPKELVRKVALPAYSTSDPSSTISEQIFIECGNEIIKQCHNKILQIINSTNSGLAVKSLNSSIGEDHSEWICTSASAGASTSSNSSSSANLLESSLEDLWSKAAASFVGQATSPPAVLDQTAVSDRIPMTPSFTPIQPMLLFHQYRWQTPKETVEAEIAGINKQTRRWSHYKILSF